MSWKTFLKLIFTIVLLLVLGYSIDLETLFSVIVSVRLELFLVAIVLQLISTLFSVFRWKIILGCFRLKVPYIETLRIVFIGNFFNLFLPSGIGGDVFRAYYLARRSRSRLSQMLTTTFLDRSAGLFALLIIGLGSSLYLDITVVGIVLSRIFILLTGIYLILNVAVFHSASHRIISKVVKGFGFHGLEEKLHLIYEGLSSLIRKPQAVFTILFLSLVIQFVSVCVVWFIALSLNFGTNFGVFLTFIPLINLSIMVPVTINGFGLRENLYRILFFELGIQEETAVALGLLQAIVMMILAFPGGMFYSLHKMEKADFEKETIR